MPFAIKLDRLHSVLQAALGWTDTHLWEFRIRGIGFGLPDPDWDFGNGPLDGRKTTLADAIEDTGAKSFKYLYDFGDGWEHTVKIEKLAPADPTLSYPRLLDGHGRCPPEDVGGPPGYAALLEVLADPEHESHDEMLQWTGGGFDPKAPVDIVEITLRLDKLARRWVRRPRKTK